MKKIGVLGTGVVGATIGKKLIELGYPVMMGSRTKGNEKAVAWVTANGSNAGEGTFADATKFGEIIFVCTKGTATLDALALAGVDNFKGKIVVDISNPLDFSKGMPPSLFICNTNSLGEEVQKLLAEAHVVKTLHMVNCQVMVDAQKCGGTATMFVSGNDKNAKDEVQAILKQFGWSDIVDLGDIKNARATEMLLPIWVGTSGVLKTSLHAFNVVKP